MNIDLTPILQAIIALLAALVTYRLIPWIKARTTESQYAHMTALVETLVFAAEKLYDVGGIENKLEYVQDQLRARGFEVDRAAIEAAVKELDLLTEPPDEAEDSPEGEPEG